MSYNFDIKMEDLWKKTQYVVEGHPTVAHPTFTYSSVVSRESVCSALTLAAFNDMDVKTSDIQNAYLTASCLEKMWTTLGSKFGPHLAGNKFLVIISLYGLKPAGTSFRNHL